MYEAIVQATPDRVPALAELLGRAFTDDPMLVWPFGADRTDLVTDFFRAFDEQIAVHGWLWEAGAGLGAAAWIPPGSDQVMMDIDRSMRSTLANAEARHEEMWEWIARNFPDEPFWYLDHIAVDAAHRGTGLGAALIRLGLDFADRDGVSAFLETGRPGNVAYYERRGFRTISDDDAPGGGPHIWFMRYEPQPSVPSPELPPGLGAAERQEGPEMMSASGWITSALERAPSPPSPASRWGSSDS